VRAGRALSSDQIRARVHALGPWFHNLVLGGVATAPDHFLGDYPMQKWRRFAHALPEDLRGRTVLDIGCNAGFYAIEMKRRGADRVVGIDHDGHYLRQARFAAEVTGVDIELRQLSVYEVGRLRERFDVVLFLGLLYHLRHPLLALDLVHAHAARDLLVVQSLLRGPEEAPPLAEDYPFWELEVFEQRGFPAMYFIERQYAGDPTNWWIPNRAGVEALIRSAGFEIVARPEAEVFVCRRRRRAGAAGSEATLPDVPGELPG
jgi:tRNA (mo5U34)-methyltransferase